MQAIRILVTRNTMMFFSVDVEKELNKEHTLESQGVSDKSNLLVTRCKKTQVLVVYNGVQFVDSYPSSAKFQSVFNKAIHHFGIGASEKDEFELYLTQEASSKINLSYPVGTYMLPILTADFKFI